MELEKAKIESIGIFRNFVTSKELTCFLESFKDEDEYSNNHNSPYIRALSKTDIGKKVIQSLKLIADRWSNVVVSGMNYTNRVIVNDLDSQAISLFIDIASNEGFGINEFFDLFTKRLHEITNAKGNNILKECLDKVTDILKSDSAENQDDCGSTILH